MLPRARTATAMAFRDQQRRPLVWVLLVIIPAYVITRSIAETLPTARQIGLPGGVVVTTTMRNLHGAGMGGLAVAFVVALVGVFVMQSALEGDRRLVLAGFHPGETVIARLLVLISATVLVVAVAAIVTALNFTAASWLPMIAALALIGLIYGAIGALAGAVLDKLAATYLILFLVMTDLGVVQSPMFHTTPGRLAVLLPGYGPSRMLYEGGVLAQLQRGRGVAPQLGLAPGAVSRGLRGAAPRGRISGLRALPTDSLRRLRTCSAPRRRESAPSTPFHRSRRPRGNRWHAWCCLLGWS